MATGTIFKDFAITDREYADLERGFGQLLCFISWQLRRRNVKNNPGVDLDDFVQDLRMSLIYAGAYYKRQLYVEACLTAGSKYATDPFTQQVLRELQSLWKNRRHHGASRQKFGPHQERLLDAIVRRAVPEAVRPRKDTPLRMDKRFATYCKSIAWNKQKALGRKISRERSFRSGLVSLSEFQYAGADHGCGQAA